MKKIIFVCHGNICRSVAAEYIMKNMTDKFEVISRATSYEEIGNDIYPPMKRELIKNGIPFDRHYAKRIDYKDYEWADYIFYMDEENRYSLERMFPNSNKILPIYKFTNEIYEIEDPWYSSRFDLVIKQLIICIKEILANIY
jgi:protein-tyrosine phosphatase